MLAQIHRLDESGGSAMEYTDIGWRAHAFRTRCASRILDAGRRAERAVEAPLRLLSRRSVGAGGGQFGCWSVVVACCRVRDNFVARIVVARLSFAETIEGAGLFLELCQSLRVKVAGSVGKERCLVCACFSRMSRAAVRVIWSWPS